MTVLCLLVDNSNTAYSSKREKFGILIYYDFVISSGIFPSFVLYIVRAVPSFVTRIPVPGRPLAHPARPAGRPNPSLLRDVRDGIRGMGLSASLDRAFS